MYNCSSSDSTSSGDEYTGYATDTGYSNYTETNCQFDNENFDFLKQIAIYERWLEQRRTLRNWWMDGFITNHRVYNVPHVSRIRFYKILACNRKGISLRIKGRR